MVAAPASGNNTHNAFTTGTDAKNQHRVTGLEARDGGANDFGDAHAFMSQNSPWCTGRYVALQDVQVRTANRCSCHSHDGVGGRADGGLGPLLERRLLRTEIDEHFHGDEAMRCGVLGSVRWATQRGVRCGKPDGWWSPSGSFLALSALVVSFGPRAGLGIFRPAGRCCERDLRGCRLGRVVDGFRCHCPSSRCQVGNEQTALVDGADGARR